MVLSPEQFQQTSIRISLQQSLHKRKSTGQIVHNFQRSRNDQNIKLDNLLDTMNAVVKMVSRSPDQHLLAASDTPDYRTALQNLDRQSIESLMLVKPLVFSEQILRIFSLLVYYLGSPKIIYKVGIVFSGERTRRGHMPKFCEILKLDQIRSYQRLIWRCEPTNISIPLQNRL